jgi:hypothetical protein
MLTVGVDLADSASDTSIEHVQRPDGSQFDDMDRAQRVDRDRRDRMPSMTINPVDFPALDESLFSYADNWIFHDGKGSAGR